jgi:putative IMPACT (imprinted ancient) family translation regulator
VAVASPIACEADAKAFIATHSDPAANHNCWAWRVGQNCRSNDDGEPSGTAGKPVLQAIDGQSLDYVAVIVTRWFGGTLLGSGGLIRAYGGTAAMCLRLATKVPLVPTVEFTVVCDFSDLALVQSRLSAIGSARVISQSYGGTGGEIVLNVHEAEVDIVRQMVLDLTSGRAIISGGDSGESA